MSRMRRFGSVVAAIVLLPIATHGQGKPEFSGDWVLVEALATGSTRASAGTSGGGVRTSVNTVSGAAFNCGTACTITLKGGTLTIANARLADYPGKDKSRPTPPLTLRLDGRDAEVVDTFSPGSSLTATATWAGNTLQIVSGRASSSIRRTQVLSMEGGHLVVEIVAYRDGERRPELTLKYRRK